MMLAMLWATATTSKPASHSDSYILLLVILGAYGCFVYFFMRPRWKRNRQIRQSGAKFEVGDKIQTVGGLLATVTRIDDRTVSVRTDSGLSLDFVKAAIGGKYQPPPDPEAAPDPDEAKTSGDAT